jgi:hypothetical protein
MTAPGTERRGLVNEIGAAITNVAVPHHEPPAVVLCRRIVVVIVLVTGAALRCLACRCRGHRARAASTGRTGRVPRSPALSAGRSIDIPSMVRRPVQQLTNIASLGMRPQSHAPSAKHKRIECHAVAIPVIPLLTGSIDPSPWVDANYWHWAETRLRDSRNRLIRDKFDDGGRDYGLFCAANINPCSMPIS